VRDTAVERTLHRKPYHSKAVDGQKRLKVPHP
jgi:hypothetical protein